MENKLGYSFEDEIISKFCYDMDNKKIEVYFTSYSDLLQNKFLKTPCVWTIEKWKDAKSKIGDDVKFYDLDKHMGIFSMILYIKMVGDNLEIIVNTIDNRYVTLVFSEPQLSLNTSKISEGSDMQ